MNALTDQRLSLNAHIDTAYQRYAADPRLRVTVAPSGLMSESHGMGQQAPDMHGAFVAALSSVGLGYPTYTATAWQYFRNNIERSGQSEAAAFKDALTLAYEQLSVVPF